MKKRNGMMILQIVLMGVLSTLVMDIGEETVKALFSLKKSLEPQHLGRWILNMFNGVFIHDNIEMANHFRFEIPVALVFHYFTGIFLGGIFIWLRNSIKILPSSMYTGFVYGWATIILPGLIMFPALGFGFFGLGTQNSMSNVISILIAHSFYGLGITLWLTFLPKLFIKAKRQMILAFVSTVEITQPDNTFI